MPNIDINMTSVNLTPEQEERAIAVFARRKKLQFRLLVPALVAFALAIAANFLPGFALGPVTHIGFVYIFLGVVVLIIFFMRFNWRCPVCGIYLGRLRNLKQCPRCGIKLEKE